ncbi:hypothetical protein [Fictibacillus terranigra]|uniref:Uncharacterized protein n=1 Tax=Fictibacillus terranigra TaxID=3058424 RepID=A0ABT8EBZ0_9BACL|nr:hypothetical protein [Fictibacillus sp. CENA-BCM004]MDN4075448.1 hypothetical protein [Fictibacillus sp. CENA-BCM004]
MDTQVIDRQAEHLEVAAKEVRTGKDIEMFLTTLKYATDIMRKFKPEDLIELRRISKNFPDIGKVLNEFVFSNVTKKYTWHEGSIHS